MREGIKVKPSRLRENNSEVWPNLIYVVIYVKHVEQLQAHSKCYENITYYFYN